MEGKNRRTEEMSVTPSKYERKTDRISTDNAKFLSAPLKKERWRVGNDNLKRER